MQQDLLRSLAERAKDKRQWNDLSNWTEEEKSQRKVLEFEYLTLNLTLTLTLTLNLTLTLTLTLTLMGGYAEAPVGYSLNNCT